MIQPGGVVEIQLSGSTKAGALGWYTVRARAQAPEGGVSQKFSIGTSMTVPDSESGAGSASLLMLLVLSCIGTLARLFRYTSTGSRPSIQVDDPLSLSQLTSSGHSEIFQTRRSAADSWRENTQEP